MSEKYCPDCGSNDMKPASLVHTWECQGCRKAFTIFVVADDIGTNTPQALFDRYINLKTNQLELAAHLLAQEGN